MRVLFVGDIVGSPGRQIVQDRLGDIVAVRQVDLVIANGENSASGFGITPRLADELLNMGIDVLTGGNHSWDRKEILEYLPHEPRLLRPANFPEGTAYITDVEMSGQHGGVIGMDRHGIIGKFLSGLPARFEVATGDVQMNCVLIETADQGPRNSAGRLRARSIERLRFSID